MAREINLNSEKKVKAQVRRILDKYKWFWWMPPGSPYGGTGISDFHAIRGGVFLAIETKQGKNKATPLQKAHLHSVQAELGLAFVINDTNVFKLDRFFELFDKQNLLQVEKKTLDADEGGEFFDIMREFTEGWAI